MTEKALTLNSLAIRADPFCHTIRSQVSTMAQPRAVKARHGSTARVDKTHDDLTCQQLTISAEVAVESDERRATTSQTGEQSSLVWIERRRVEPLRGPVSANGGMMTSLGCRCGMPWHALPDGRVAASTTLARQ